MIIRDQGPSADGPDNLNAPEVGTRPLVGVRDRQPKGDHNRRLSLGVDVDDFALEAGVSANQLREYELTSPDHDFDLEVAARVGAALDRLEADPPPTQKVSNGPPG